jgi:hypothetical protein
MILKRHVFRKEAEEGEDLPGDKPEEVKDEAKGTEVDPEIIAKAEKMGWTPKDQFRGDPAKWRPADEFVERGENMLPIVKSTVKKQEREIAELKQTVAQFADYLTKTEARAYDKALSTLKAEQAAAVAAADGAAFVEVGERIENLQKEMASKAAPVKKSEAGDTAEFDEWLSRNRWAEDKKLQVIAAGIRDAMVVDGEKAQGNELLDLVTAEMKRRYPEKFENPRRAAAVSAVEGGTGPRKSGGKSYADLPADARAACDRMAKNGYGHDPKAMAQFKADYTRNYFEA